jgi:pimeloyl-ACP methyl ester carboxylesterase
MSITRINGVRLFWDLRGETGDLLVLVHGSWGNHHNWDSVVPGLARSFRVVTYDRRGHSQSERPGGQGHVEEDVADLAALIDQIGCGPAHIAGNSFGAAIVLRLAGERPDLFRSLIVHEPPLFRLLEHEPEAQAALSAITDRIGIVVRMLEAGDHLGGARQFVETIAYGPGAWERLSADVRETFVFNAPTWLDEAHDPESLTLNLDRLRALSAPALLTFGGQSPPFFPLVVRQIAQRIPQAVTRTFPGAGHVPHLSHPDEYVSGVTRFADEAMPVRRRSSVGGANGAG